MGIYGLIADDLTGAMDAGMQMLHAGKRVKVALNPTNLDLLAKETDFIVVNTQSRNISPDSAYNQVSAALNELAALGCNQIYKKIDSTLRGNLGAELAAILASNRYDSILVAPALPYNLRTTKNGIHYVDGIELAETELAKDPFSPLTDSAIADLIAAQTSARVGLVELATVKQGSVSIEMKILELVTAGFEIIVVDAVTEKDLEQIAVAAKLATSKLMLCGSAGLCRYLNQVSELDQVVKESGMPTSEGPILIVSGSPASMSKAQIKQLVDENSQVELISYTLNESPQVIVTEVLNHLKQGRHVVVDAAGESKVAIFEQAGSKAKLDANSDLILDFVASLTEQVAETLSLGALVLVGGDTAVAVTDRLGAQGIKILAEIEPYIPLGELVGGAFAGLPVVTKAGGFGNIQSLIAILRYLGG